jgi:hypothetical protein
MSFTPLHKENNFYNVFSLLLILFFTYNFPSSPHISLFSLAGLQ